MLTLTWIKSGLAVEANPFLEPFLLMGDCAFLATKMLLTGAACIILYFNRKLQFGKIIICATIVVYGLLILYHCLGAWAVLDPNNIPRFIEKLVIWLA